MAEYITLMGAEEVSRAASRMQSAAETMSQAASSIDHSNEMFLRRFDEIVSRLEEAVVMKEDERSIFEQVFGKRHG